MPSPAPSSRALCVAALLLVSACATTARRGGVRAAGGAAAPVPATDRGEVEPCGEARRDWGESARHAREAIGALDACLAVGAPACAMETAAARATLAELSINAQRVFGTCPAGR